jgi:hypothetical protein
MRPGPRDDFVRARWKAVADLENGEGAALIGNGEGTAANAVTLALAARDKLSPFAIEKKKMHNSVISAEEEAGMILRNTEAETGLEPTLIEQRITEEQQRAERLIQGSGMLHELKRFDVEFKEPQRQQIEGNSHG